MQTQGRHARASRSGPFHVGALFSGACRRDPRLGGVSTSKLKDGRRQQQRLLLESFWYVWGSFLRKVVVGSLRRTHFWRRGGRKVLVWLHRRAQDASHSNTFPSPWRNLLVFTVWIFGGLRCFLAAPPFKIMRSVSCLTASALVS